MYLHGDMDLWIWDSITNGICFLKGRRFGHVGLRSTACREYSKQCREVEEFACKESGIVVEKTVLQQMIRRTGLVEVGGSDAAVRYYKP